MHNITLRSMLEGIGDLNSGVDRARQIRWSTFLNDFAQIGAFDKFKDDVVPAVFIADRVHATNVFMVEAGR